MEPMSKIYKNVYRWAGCQNLANHLFQQQNQRQMSFSLTPSDVVRKHPTNTSTSKEIHSFSKSNRFIAPNPECPNIFYTYDSQLSNRKASFGYGGKSDFTKTLAVSPSSNSYDLPTFLDESRRRGKSFGTEREKLPNNSYLVPQMQKVPGPSYENDKKKRNNYSFTMRPKPVDFIDKKLTFKQSPGPSCYSQVDLEPKNGRFMVSKFSDSPYAIINPKTERFRTGKSTPGPSSYADGDSINGNGKYVLSQRKSNGRRVFSKTARDVFWKVNGGTPGPGSYVETSEFGHYGNSSYYKTLNK